MPRFLSKNGQIFGGHTIYFSPLIDSTFGTTFTTTIITTTSTTNNNNKKLYEDSLVTLYLKYIVASCIKRRTITLIHKSNCMFTRY